jgi:hypothetical protein
MPKVVQTSLAGIKEITNQFGIPAVSLKKVLPFLPKMFDHKDPSVRTEVDTIC